MPQYKTNLTARYTFEIGSFDAYLQGAFSYQDDTNPSLLSSENEVIGINDAYGLADFSAGISKESFSIGVFLNNAFDERADIARFSQCRPEVCSKPYIITNQPRTVGVRFGQRF